MTDVDERDILPTTNTTDFEAALLNAMSQAWAIDKGALARESDPMLCSSDKLLDLFFERGGTYWNDDWSKQKKRIYIKNLQVYKRLEGTPLGVELYANLEGAYIVREELPPGRSFIAEGVASPDDLLALMPQIRLYYYWPDSILPRQLAVVRRGFVNQSATKRSRAVALGRYPVLFDPLDGSSTPLQIVSVDVNAQTVVLGRQGYGGSAAYVGQAFAGKSLLGRPARPDPIVFNLADPFLERVNVSPPCRKQEAAVRVRFVGQSFITSSRPGLGTYDRLYLWDPTRIKSTAGKAGRKAFVSATRLGVPPYNAILTIAIPGFPVARPRRSRFIGYANTFGQARKPIHRVMQAIECARRPGDRLLIKTVPFVPGSRPAPVPAIGDLL